MWHFELYGDYPCNSSRFDKLGVVLNGPVIKNLSSCQSDGLANGHSHASDALTNETI